MCRYIYCLNHVQLSDIFRMKGVAKKFNLNFERDINTPLFELRYPINKGGGKQNIIKGDINGNRIEIYDYILRPIAELPVGWSIEHHTIFKKNDIKTDIRGMLEGKFRVGIKKINKWIYSIKEKE